MQKLFVTLALAALALPTLADAPTKPVPPVVQKYLALLTSTRTLSVEAAQIVPPGSLTDTAHLMLSWPNKIKLTSQVGGKSIAGIVSNGKTLWEWDQTHFSKQSAPVSLTEIADVPPMGVAAQIAASFWITVQDFPLANVRDAGVVQVDRQRAHQFVASRRGVTATFWFAENTGLPLRYKLDAKQRVYTVTFRHYLLNQPVASNVFAARPPKGLQARSPQPTQTEPELLKVGSPAPDFTMPTPDGGTVSLSSFKGKPVLIDFWATWCGPCMAAMPHIQTLHQELGDAVTVLSVNTSDTKDKWASFVKKNTQYTTQMLFDGTDVSGKLYKVTGIPTVYLIDKNGNVAATYVGYDPVYEAQIKATLAKLGQ